MAILVTPRQSLQLFPRGGTVPFCFHALPKSAQRLSCLLSSFQPTCCPKWKDNCQVGSTKEGAMGIQEWRNALRGLRSAPGFTVTTMLSLSLGIGGTVSMFTVVNSIVLRPLAYGDSGRLVR